MNSVAPWVASEIAVKYLGLVEYQPTWQAMQAFSASRTEHTPDELWLLEHPAVFTQGQAGKAEHLLLPGNIPVVQSDRGGQVTYHGPGQLVIYLLIDIGRRGYGVRSLVTRIETAMVETLSAYDVAAFSDRDAPGVYVEHQGLRRKIGSLGLRVRQGRSLHGLSLNVAMDLEPFSRINPCGYSGLAMTQLADLGGPTDVQQVADALAARLVHHLQVAE